MNVLGQTLKQIGNYMLLVCPIGQRIHSSFFTVSLEKNDFCTN